MLSRSRNNPDVLMCLANLSSDEVFTPPALANKMLDLLPQELFTSPGTKFLDPACKSGVFLREIVKRLIAGLAGQIPDLQERVNHIMRHQVYGIAVTELTGMVSRRTVYCSMNVNSRFSVCRFDDGEGNVRFRECGHSFGRDGRCEYCGVRRKNDDEGEESYAYEFIHTARPEEIWGMKFDVVISNPPYQVSDGGFGASARPIYHLFVEQAKKLQPKYITMIIPARWYAGGKGLDDFREDMLNDRRIRVIHDYPDASECFPGDVQIKGGVCYFLWDRDNEGDCEVTNHKGENLSVMTRPLIERGISTFIRYNEAISILRKVRSFHEERFSSVQPRKPFGLDTLFHGEKDSAPDMVKCYENKGVSYVRRGDIMQNVEWIDQWKVYISEAYGAGDSYPHQIINVPFIGEPGSVCSETYLLIGPLANEQQAHNIISYISTKFFRFLVLLKKNTQHATQKVYSLVPYVPEYATQKWDDERLYAKYSLSPEEIAFIDSMIRPMPQKETAAS